MDEQAHVATRSAEKVEAMAEIWATLNGIEAQRRNPNLWERLCLVRAFQGIFSGCYGLALTEARLARLLPDQQVPSSRLPTDPITDRADLSFLFKVAKAAQAEPVRRFPHFGSIEVE